MYLNFSTIIAASLASVPSPFAIPETSVPKKLSFTSIAHASSLSTNATVDLPTTVESSSFTAFFNVSISIESSDELTFASPDTSEALKSESTE